MISYVAGGITMPIISAPLCVVNASLSLGKWVLNMLSSTSRQASKEVNDWKFTNSQFKQKLCELECIEKLGEQTNTNDTNADIDSKVNKFYNTLKNNDDNIKWSALSHQHLSDAKYIDNCTNTNEKLIKMKALIEIEIDMNELTMVDINKHRYQPELNAKNTLYFAIATIPVIGYTLAEKFVPKATWVN